MEASEREVKDFRFQQLCRIRIFDPPDSPFQGVTQLIACSSKYGLTFLGTTNGFKVIKTSDVTDIDIRHAAERTTLIVADPPIRTSVQVEGAVSHLCLSCDELTLAVVVTCNGIIQIYIYDVKGFANQGQNVEPFQKIRVTSEVLDLAWNPTQPTLLVVCMSDGRAQLLEVAENFKIVASLPPVVSACSVCWSPKGKQLVIGTGNGTLMQFDHELKKKRDWDRPSVLPEDQQFEVKGVSWISTYMFLASYFPRGSPDDQPTVVLTSGSKDGAPAFINFLDPCYGNGEGIASTMHFNYIPQWEMVLCTSSTACETAIVGKHFDDKNTFERWTLDDAARAELPLTEDYADTFPLGAAIDFSSQFQVPVGEQRYPPCPMFMLLSTDGVLVTYYMMYSHAEAQAQPITSPPQDLPAGPVRRPTAANAQGSVQKDAAPIEARPTPQSGQPGLTSAVPPSQAADNKASAFGFSASGSTGKSLFGAPASQGFGFTSSTPSSGGAPGSIFGQSNTATTQVASSTPSTGGAAGSVFGQSNTATTQVASTTTSSGGAPGSIFGQSNTTTQVGQSFLASALSAPMTAAATSTTKTGFADTSNALSQFSFKPQPAANFSLNASVTKPSIAAVPTQPVGASTAGGFSLPGQSSGGSHSGFNFSLSSLNTTGQTTSSSSAPASSKAVTAPVTQSQITSGTSAASKQPVFSFSSSAAPSEGFGVKPLATSTTPAFGMTPTTTVTAATTKSIFGTPGSSSLSKFGSTPETAQPNAPSMSSAVKTATGGSSLLMRGFGSSSVPTFGTKPGAAAVTPTFGDAKSATMTPGSIPPPQSKPAIAAALTSSFGGSMQNLSALGQGPNLNNTKQQSSPGVERQQSEGSRSKTPVADASQKTSSASESLNDTFSASIAEEIAHFEKELCEFRQRAGAVRESIGSKEDMQRLRNNTTKISNFCDEVKANTKELSKEISDLKSLCLDGFAMVEDCKMREQRNTDAQYVQLLRNRALDPKSLATMRSLQQQQQLLDQGLRDVDAILDQEWEDYQNKKKKRQGIQRPTTDGIYQVIKSNRNLIIREKNQLDDLETQLKQLKLYNRNSSWKHPDTSREPAELSSLADSLLESPKKAPDDPRRTPSVQTLDPNKQAKLREYLSRKTVTKVKSTRPENLSMSRLASTEKIRQALSRQSSPTKAPSSAEMKSMVQGRPILRATSHNGSRQLVNQGLQPTSPGMEAVTRQQISMQLKPNTYQQGFMFANSGNTKPSLMAFQQKLPQNLKPADQYPQYEDITPTSTDATEDEDDDDYDEDDDDDDDDDEPDSEHDSEPLNRKIAERKPPPSSTAPVMGLSGAATTKPLSFSPQTFGQGMSGFTSFTAGGNKPVFGAKPDSTTPTGSPKPSFSAGFQGFKPDEKTPTNTSTPKTAFKFGSDVQPSFGGKNLFGQPLKTEDKKTEESKPISSPLLAKALTADSEDDDDLGLGKNDTATEQAKLDNKTSGKPSTEPKFDTASKTPSFGFGKVPSSIALSDLGKEGSGQPLGVTSGLFGQPSGTSVFGGAISSTTTSSAGKSVFGFGASVGASSGGGFFGQSSTTSGGLFGKSTKDEDTDKASPKTTASTGLFGQNLASSSTGLFGQKSSQASVTSKSDVSGQDTSSKVASSTVASASENPPASELSTASAISSAAGMTSSTPGSSLFGQPQTTTATSGLFGQTSAAVSTAGSGLFGQKTTSSGTTYGQALAPPPPPTYSSTEAGLLGRPLTSGSGAFGQSSTTSAIATSLFGQQTTTTGSGSLSKQTTTTGSGLFGQPATSSGAGLFGQPTTTASGLFGQANAASSTSGTGLFGQSSTTSTSGGGLFGTSASSSVSTAGTSVFGQVSSSSTNASTGLFGQTGSGGFGQSSTGTKPSVLGGLLTGTDEAPATSTAFGQGGPSKNLFGTETSSAAPSFGQPAPLFGSSTASTGPGFEGTTTSAGFGSAGSGFGFGGSATTTSATGFGQTNQTGLFEQPTSSSSSAFGGFGSASSGQTSGGMFGGGGGMFSGLGGKPSEDKAKTNVFGAVPTFGSTAATQANLFGNQSPSTLGSAGGSSPFSGSGFSGGGSNVASTGFGVAKSQSPSGFGAPPSFGGTPGFGSQAAFGSSPSFGSAPAFGGGSTFGGGSSFQNQLGSPQNTGGGGGGFAGFASSASPTFGSLAQGGSTPPTFGSVPQGGGGFGGFGATGGGGGGFGGASPGFGQAPSSGGNPSFTGYRG